MNCFDIWSVLTGILVLAFAYRTWRFRRHLVALGDLPHEEGRPWPKVSLVIPACNEGDTIEEALWSLLETDYPNLEIILINDRSTDQTGHIVDQMSLADARVVPVHVNYLPEGWLGKVNAMNRGINMTSGEYILLSDADVHFAKNSLKKAVRHAQAERLDFLTIIPDVITKTRLLHMVIAQLFHQASLFFRPEKINDPSHRACYGQGAFMLLRKSTYLRSEMMPWLKMEVIDDTGLALMMRRAGAKMGAVSGRRQVMIEWYPSFRGFLKGIEKNAFAFSQYSLAILFGFAAAVFGVFLGFTMAPALSSHWIYPVFTTGALGVYLVTIHLQLREIMHMRPWTVLVFPLAFIGLPVFFMRASLMTLRRGGVNWRGTFYSLTALKENQRMKLANLVFAPPSVDEVAVTDESELPVRF